MNPYEVLGVSENADEETIKKAYRLFQIHISFSKGLL